MLNYEGCIFLFALYISGIHTISKPLDTVNVNLNIDEQKPPAYPTPAPTTYPAAYPTPAPTTYPPAYQTAAYDGVVVGAASSGGEQAAASSCEDKNPEDCPGWRRYCTSEIKRERDYMQENCQKTCSACPDTKRVRKNVANLTLSEKQRLRTALEEAIVNEEPWKNYKDHANIHGDPVGPTSPCYWEGCCPHGDKGFLTWHRLYSVNMEQLLGHPLPYWKWTESGDLPDLWEDILGPIKEDAISRSDVGCVGSDNTHHRRGPNIFINATNLKERILIALDTDKFNKFYKAIKGPHDDIHGWIGCDMNAPERAAYDPIFYLHHCYIDYIFAYWQELQRLRKEKGLLDDDWEADFDGSSTLKPFDNREVNPYEITQKNSWGSDVLDYQNNLGYEYDKLIFHELTPEQFLNREKVEDVDVDFREDVDFGEDLKPKRHKGYRIYAGIVVPKVSPTRRIDFTVCNSTDHCVEGGHVTTFGSDSDSVSDPDPANNILLPYDVTHIFNEETGFDEKAYVHIIPAEDQDADDRSRFQPVIIWSKNKPKKLVKEETVYLAKGVSKNEYGTLLDDYDDVVENKSR